MEKRKWNKTYLLFMILAIAIPLFFAWIFFRTQKDEQYIVSVIVGEADSERWAVMQQGMEKAAKDSNAQINFYSISDVRNVEEQIALIIREMDKQADAIIVDSVDSKKLTKALSENTFNTKIILVETDLQPEQLYPQVCPDNYKIGADLGKQIVKEGITSLGILLESDRTVASQERLQGLHDTIAENAQIQVRWTISNQDMFEKANWYFEYIDVEAMVALDSISTKEAVSTVQENKLGTKIYGVGNTESNIYYLDKGLIAALAIVNEYNMGYFSMQTAIAKITSHHTENTNIIDHIMVVKENLYDEETQRLVFPFVQ